MDDLPDELLLAILGLLDDGTALLDAVPLVCKRWHRVSRDPRAWAGVGLRWRQCANSQPHVRDCTHSHHAAMRDSARVLLRAPALRRFEFCQFGDWDSDYGCREERRYVRSALRRSAAAIRAVEVSCRFRQLGTPELADMLLDLVVRSRRELRALHLGGMAMSSGVERALSQLGRLESLGVSLAVDDTEQGFEPSGALRGALPHLRRLSLAGRLAGLEPRSVRLLADILDGGAAKSLRELRFLYGAPLPSDFLDQVWRCSGLHTLACDAVNVAVLLHLPMLRSVELGCYNTTDSSLRAKLEAITDSLEPSSLDSILHVRLNCEGLAGLYGNAQLRSLFLGGLLAGLAAAAPALVHLEITQSDILGRKTVDAVRVAERMHSLRSVRLSRCTADFLRVFAALPQLESLTARLVCGGRNGQIDCTCEAVRADIQRERPDLKTNIAVVCRVTS